MFIRGLQELLRELLGTVKARLALRRNQETPEARSLCRELFTPGSTSLCLRILLFKVHGPGTRFHVQQTVSSGERRGRSPKGSGALVEEVKVMLSGPRKHRCPHVRGLPVCFHQRPNERAGDCHRSVVGVRWPLLSLACTRCFVPILSGGRCAQTAQLW